MIAALADGFNVERSAVIAVFIDLCWLAAVHAYQGVWPWQQALPDGYTDLAIGRCPGLLDELPAVFAAGVFTWDDLGRAKAAWVQLGFGHCIIPL